MQFNLLQLLGMLAIAALALATARAPTFDGSLLWLSVMAAIALHHRLTHLLSRGLIDIVFRELRITASAAFWGAAAGLALDVPCFLLWGWPANPACMMAGGMCAILGCQLLWPDFFHIHPALATT